MLGTVFKGCSIKKVENHWPKCFLNPGNTRTVFIRLGLSFQTGCFWTTIYVEHLYGFRDQKQNPNKS